MSHSPASQWHPLHYRTGGCCLRPVDQTVPEHYIGLMAKKEPKETPVEKELRLLEARVDELIRAIERLSAENRSLRNRQEGMAGERAQLIEKHEAVRSRVESMINRLKSMEHSA